MTEIARCQLCGEPMPQGETMFNYHGYSGPCPKPPLPRPSVEAVVEYLHYQDRDEFILAVKANGEIWYEARFDTVAERQRCHDDLLSMMRSMGAKDLPGMKQ